MNAPTDPSAALAALDPKVLAQLTPEHLKMLIWQRKWALTRRDKQTPPPGDWTEWGILAGRGFGKTLTGAQWLGQRAFMDTEALPRAVIAPTLNDVRYTCFEGPAGLMSIIPPDLIADYNKTNLILTLKTPFGLATIRGFSAEEPERMRGPQFADLWCDELAAWTQGEETWDMAMMGLRLGPHPRVVWTTTPKPKDLVRKLVEPKTGRVITSGSTYENKANLPDSFFKQLVQYEGTQLGRQELNGELIDAEEGGIIQRSWLKLWPAEKPLPALEWIIMSMDTAFTEKTINKRTFDADDSACTVWGVFQHDDRRNVMLLDCWAEQYGMPDLIKRVKKEMNVAYGDDEDRALIKPLIGPSKMASSGRKPDILLLEDKGSGISLRQMLEREGITAYAYNPGRADKLTRLHMVSHIFARGQVWLPESEKHKGRPKSWIEPMIAQLCSFTGPKSIKHDDYVDAVSQALRLCMDKNLLSDVKQSKRREQEAPPPPRVAANPYTA
jgi:predicted phage terminase large subunit-like protein